MDEGGRYRDVPVQASERLDCMSCVVKVGKGLDRARMPSQCGQQD